SPPHDERRRLGRGAEGAPPADVPAVLVECDDGGAPGARDPAIAGAVADEVDKLPSGRGSRGGQPADALAPPDTPGGSVDRECPAVVLQHEEATVAEHRLELHELAAVHRPDAPERRTQVDVAHVASARRG